MTLKFAKTRLSYTKSFLALQKKQMEKKYPSTGKLFTAALKSMKSGK